jgi:hypothetical protein
MTTYTSRLSVLEDHPDFHARLGKFGSTCTVAA